MTEGRTLEARIAAERARLSPAERRVAEVVLEQPELVAFGTVARVADKAGTSGASVLRLAARLGYQGFTDLQAAVLHRYEALPAGRPAGAALRQARWMVEEYRVSLWAQHLGTAQTVSDARIRKVLAG